jgi:hypothetical protein
MSEVREAYAGIVVALYHGSRETSRTREPHWATTVLTSNTTSLR